MYRVYNPIVHSPSKTKLKSLLTKNKSMERIETFMKLPRLNKSFRLDIEDNDFTLQYFENKNRIELTYRQKDLPAGVDRNFP
jgi:hypothetical protein